MLIGDGLNSLTKAEPVADAAANFARSDEPFPLSELQRAYVIGRNSGIPLGGIGCHVYFELEVPDYDAVRFERCWNSLIRKHEILRLVFDGTDRQRILPEVPWYRIETHTISDCADPQATALLDSIRREMSQCVHDLTKWPLHELRVVRIPTGRGRVFAGFDLFGIDAASIFRLFEKLEQEYKSERPPAFSRPAVGFREYRLAEEARKNQAVWARDRDWWQKQAPTLPGGPQLPYAVPLDTITRAHFERIERRLDEATIGRLTEAAGKHGLTLSKVINAAFAEVIAAWSAEREFLLNFPIFTGPGPGDGEQEAFGNFTANLVVAADMSEGSFSDRAKRFWRSMARALRHRSYSGVDVLQDLRRLGGDPLSPIAPVVMTNLLTHEKYAGTWRRAPVYGMTRTPQVVLDHQVARDEDGIVFHWDAAIGAFRDGVVAAMADAHLSLLCRLADEPLTWTRPSLDLLDARQAAVRARANATARDPDRKLLHSGFFDFAALYPRAPALVDGNRIVSFGELAALAESVRCLLAKEGVRDGDSVACAMAHGVNLAAVALGTLKQGAVYAPLDPASPSDRRRNELDILEPRLVLADSGTAASVAGLNAKVRLLDRLAESSTIDSDTESAVSPDARAYVLFTSGTTGRPKAIAITHDAAINTCGDLKARFSLASTDRVLGLSAPTFDLSIFDMFGIWAAGGCCVLPGLQSRIDPSVWADTIDEYRITVWNSVPALMSMLAVQCEAQERILKSLRLVMLSGDWIPPKLVPRIERLCPNARLVSLGGATEASIWSIYHMIKSEDASLPSIPYGLPLGNQTIHVLDEILSERPDHVEGDIFIGGRGLAEGYLKEPERTAKAFVRHPETGMRLYRTGDRGRRLPNGEVEFLGRRDTQLKLQGYRIEAGDIESRLRELPSVDEAIVDVVGDKFESKRLVAFVKRSVAVAAGLNSGRAPTLPTENEGGDTFGKARVNFKMPRATGNDAVGLRRRSARSFGRSHVALNDLAAILQPLCNLEEGARVRFSYPSASGLYPVRAYLYLEAGRVVGVESGLYRIEPEGVLTEISRTAIDTVQLHVPHNRDLASASAFTLLLFAHMPAIAPKYGPMARDLCLLEAGYIGQALMQAATRTSCSLCPIGAMNFGPIAALAGLTSDDQFLHGFVGGVADEQNESVLPGSNNLRVFDEETFVRDLRAHASAGLPPYMVPGDFIIVDQFPLTGNSKVDRRALHVLLSARAGEDKRMEFPQNDVEAKLSELASRILGIAAVDVNREFFAMGADSLKLVEMSAAIEKEFGRFNVVDAFAHPTIRRLAAHLADSGHSKLADDSVMVAARRRAENRRVIRTRIPASDASDEQ